MKPNNGHNSDPSVLKKVVYEDEAVSEEEDERPGVYPSKFRCRGRIGRGGRLVVDRVPIYDDENSTAYNTSATAPYSTTVNNKSKQSIATAASAYNGSYLSGFTTRWVHATSLPPPSKLHRGPGTEFIPRPPDTLPARTRSDSLSGSSPPLHPHTTSSAAANKQVNPMHPIILPLSNGELPESYLSREREVYALSDSEDEKVDFIRPKKATVPKLKPGAYTLYTYLTYI